MISFNCRSHEMTMFLKDYINPTSTKNYSMYITNMKNGDMSEDVLKWVKQYYEKKSFKKIHKYDKDLNNVNQFFQETFNNQNQKGLSHYGHPVQQMVKKEFCSIVRKISPK